MIHPRFARLLRQLAFVLVSLVVTFVGLEIGLRVLDPFHTGEVLDREAFERRILEPHPERLQSVLRQNAIGEFLGEVHTTNSARMRGPDYPRAKQDGVYRIVVAGDSVAFGWGVAEHECFPRVLERMLDAMPTKPAGIERFEVVNGGTPGWGIPAYCLWLREYGFDYEPDAVVVTFINNDFTNLIKAVQAEGPQPDLLVIPAWTRWSYVARAVQNVHALLTGAEGDLGTSLKSTPLQAPAVELALAGFAEIHGDCGDRPMVVMDTLGDEDGSWLPGFVAGMAERGIPRIDAFLPLANYEAEFAVSAIDVHPNAHGHRRFAEWLFEWFERDVFGR